MAEKKVIDLQVNTNIDETNQKLNKLQDSLGKVSKESANTTKELTSSLDKVSGGALSAFNNLKGGLQSVIGGFNSLKVAIIGTGIGALILAIIAVKEAFTSSEEGQNKFAKIMAVIGSITGNLTDLLSKLGMIIIGVFENPKKAINDFANLIKDQIVNRFMGLLELIPQLGKAVGLLFEGKFKEAGKIAFDATSKVTTGVENLSDKIGDATQKTKEFILEMQREAKIAQQIADQRAKADKTDRALIVEKAEAERKRADLLEKAKQKDKFNQAERIAFLREASKIDEEITNKEIESAKLRRDAKIEENKLSNSNKDALKEEEELKANVIRLETQRLQRQKEVTGQIQGLIEQEKASNKARFEEKKRLQEEELNAEFANQEKINAIRQKFRLQNEDAEDITEFEKLNRKYERDLLELVRLGATEQQKLDLETYYTNLRNEQYIGNIDYLEQLEIEAEDRRLERLQKDAKKQIEVDKIVATSRQQIRDAELNNIGRGFNLLGQLAGKNKTLQVAAIIGENAVGIAKQVIATRAANAAVTAKYALIPGGLVLAQAEKSLNNVSLGLGVGASIAATSKALSALKAGGNVTGSTGASDTGGSGSGAQTPSFNIVGQGGANQLAQSIGQQSNQPIRTYVVSSDVSTSQALDRNIVQGASLG